jgi:hypothetical protein
MYVDLEVTYSVSGQRPGSSKVAVPTHCPTCGNSVYFRERLAQVSNFVNRLEVVLQCTGATCDSMVLAYYKKDDSGSWALDLIEPSPPVILKFPEIIKDISPAFLSIYTEATIANEKRLKQIAGPGYRKAIEFLIKDYAKLLNDEKDYKNIEDQPVAAVLNNYLKKSRVHEIAKRTVWLGNDETHYMRKWVDRNIEDLIKLIRLTVSLIDLEKQEESYIEDMPSQ